MLRASLCGSCLGLLLAWSTPTDGAPGGDRPNATRTAASRLLAEGSALYLEDALVPRPIALATARVLAVDGALQLHLTVSASGPGVEPLPGFAGVPGSNLRTAEELDRLLAADALQLVTRGDGAVHRGTLQHVERRRMPARRVTADGHLRSAATAATWPTAVTFTSAPLPTGTSWSYLEADGLPRLAVEVARDGAAIRLAITSLGEPVPQPRQQVGR